MATAMATTCSWEQLCTERGDGAMQQCRSPNPRRTNDMEESQVRKKVALFLKEAERNRRQIEMLEKERILSVQCRKNGWTDVCSEPEEYERALREERIAEKVNLQKQLVKIQNGIRKFQRQLMDVKPTPSLIEKLQRIMSEVEISINAMREEQHSCFEELMKEERVCRQEITAYEKKIEIWRFDIKSDHKPHAAPVVMNKPLNRDLPGEVRALESFLQKTGGSCGGWEEYDHQAFLRVWTKHGGQPAYRKEAKLYLPSKTMQEIQQHEDWYQRLLYLQDRKREVIRMWKARKYQELQTRVQRQNETEEAERNKKRARNQAWLQKAKEEKREAAQRLEEWKEAKRRKKEAEQQRMAEEIRRRRLPKEERRPRIERKLAVDELLQLKREEEEQKGTQEEEEEREMDESREKETQCSKHLSEEDLHKVQVKLQEKLMEEEEEEEERQEKLTEKVDDQVSKDPTRLTCLTKR